jgi:hypothetical protein
MRPADRRFVQADQLSGGLLIAGADPADQVGEVVEFVHGRDPLGSVFLVPKL